MLARLANRAPDPESTATRTRTPIVPDELRWAGARLAFFAYLGFSLFSVVGGFLTAPLMSWYMFGTWKFWRYLKYGPALFVHGWKMLLLTLRDDASSFMFDVPLTAPPHSAPVPGVAKLNPTWPHGNTCDTCNRCCEKIGCPILEEETGLCRGYDSFFWRYFNCGRFPSRQREVDYYDCPKWLMVEPAHGKRRRRRGGGQVA